MKTALRLLVGLLLVVFLFGVVLPALVDYRLVFEAMRGLKLWQFAVLLVLGLLRIVSESSLYASVIPDLGFVAGLRSYLASNTVGDLAPPPADLAVRFGMYRALGIGTERAGAGIILSGVFSIGARLVLPVVALVLVLLSGPADEETWLLALLGVAALVGVSGLVALMLRSEQATERIGSWVGDNAERIARRMGREFRAHDLGTRATAFRSRIVSTARGRWPYSIAAVLTSHLLTYATLLAAMRFVGVSNQSVDWLDLLVAYAIVRLITLIPITPGGIGVAAAGYVLLLSPGQDQTLTNLIGAASFLTRIFVWLVPLLVGLVPLLAWRRAARPESEEEDHHEKATGLPRVQPDET